MIDAAYCGSIAGSARGFIEVYLALTGPTVAQGGCRYACAVVGWWTWQEKGRMEVEVLKVLMATPSAIYVKYCTLSRFIYQLCVNTLFHGVCTASISQIA